MLSELTALSILVLFTSLLKTIAPMKGLLMVTYGQLAAHLSSQQDWRVHWIPQATPLLCTAAQIQLSCKTYIPHFPYDFPRACSDHPDLPYLGIHLGFSNFRRLFFFPFWIHSSVSKPCQAVSFFSSTRGNTSKHDMWTEKTFYCDKIVLNFILTKSPLPLKSDIFVLECNFLRDFCSIWSFFCFFYFLTILFWHVAWHLMLFP